MYPYFWQEMGYAGLIESSHRREIRMTNNPVTEGQ